MKWLHMITSLASDYIETFVFLYNGGLQLSYISGWATFLASHGWGLVSQQGGGEDQLSVGKCQCLGPASRRAPSLRQYLEKVLSMIMEKEVDTLVMELSGNLLRQRQRWMDQVWGRVLCEATPREALKLIHERFSNKAGKHGRNVFRDRRKNLQFWERILKVTRLCQPGLQIIFTRMTLVVLMVVCTIEGEVSKKSRSRTTISSTINAVKFIPGSHFCPDNHILEGLEWVDWKSGHRGGQLQMGGTPTSAAGFSPPLKHFLYQEFCLIGPRLTRPSPFFLRFCRNSRWAPSPYPRVVREILRWLVEGCSMLQSSRV